MRHTPGSHPAPSPRKKPVAKSLKYQMRQRDTGMHKVLHYWTYVRWVFFQPFRSRELQPFTHNLNCGQLFTFSSANQYQYPRRRPRTQEFFFFLQTHLPPALRPLRLERLLATPPPSNTPRTRNPARSRSPRRPPRKIRDSPLY
jgi:hypothetical protein